MEFLRKSPKVSEGLRKSPKWKLFGNHIVMEPFARLHTWKSPPMDGNLTVRGALPRLQTWKLYESLTATKPLISQFWFKVFYMYRSKHQQKISMAALIFPDICNVRCTVCVEWTFKRADLLSWCAFLRALYGACTCARSTSPRYYTLVYIRYGLTFSFLYSIYVIYNLWCT